MMPFGFLVGLDTFLCFREGEFPQGRKTNGFKVLAILSICLGVCVNNIYFEALQDCLYLSTEYCFNFNNKLFTYIFYL